MTTDKWQEFARRCQKPDHRTVGNWYARRISRPLALRITRVILPTGVSAHTMTLLAWLAGLGAVGALATGSSLGWLVGAVLLQTSYLLDHVDGQVARYRGVASLDGIALDYLMHHTLNLLVPLSVAYGVVAQGDSHTWLLVGLIWAVGSWLNGCEHDVRCKAIVARLKRLHGELRVAGGGGGRPTPPAPWPRTPLAFLVRLARLIGQWHVIVNTLTLLAVIQLVMTNSLWLVEAYLLAMGPVTLLIALAQIHRAVATSATEREFAAWYHPPAGSTLVERDGWWHVDPLEDAENSSSSRLRAESQLLD